MDRRKKNNEFNFRFILIYILFIQFSTCSIAPEQTIKKQPISCNVCGIIRIKLAAGFAKDQLIIVHGNPEEVTKTNRKWIKNFEGDNISFPDLRYWLQGVVAHNGVVDFELPEGKYNLQIAFGNGSWNEHTFQPFEDKYGSNTLFIPNTYWGVEPTYNEVLDGKECSNAYSKNNHDLTLFQKCKALTLKKNETIELEVSLNNIRPFPPGNTTIYLRHFMTVFLDYILLGPTDPITADVHWKIKRTQN
ncbi:hypothetical protein AB3N59_19650 [Leptospira sp. WS92.C1]